MKKTCKYCGVVDINHVCPFSNKIKQKLKTKSNTFRNTNAWKNKSKYIKRRDLFMCQMCLQNKYNTINQINWSNLEVHHIQDDYSLRLDDENLITLCRYHHELAENGTIPQSELKEIIKLKNDNNYIPIK